MASATYSGCSRCLTNASSFNTLHGLVRHFQCKESLAAAQYLTEAMDRYAAGYEFHDNATGCKFHFSA